MGFLETVVDDKRREVEAKRVARPLERLREAAAAIATRDFLAAVSRPGAVIAELKARTPSVTAFRHSRALIEVADAYARGGGAAISIVTDAARFGTSLDDVRAVRERVSLPVLAKDFVVDPYQIVEARAAGADAILLIVRLLDLDRLRAFLALAERMGMNALVEVHSEPEVLAALAAGARIVGINNRDLDTMSVSLDTTRRLAPLVPEGIVTVAESGIRSRAEIDDLAAHGATAFLVGGSLLASDDPETRLRELTAVPAPGPGMDPR